MTLVYQPLQIPLVGGLDTKEDARFLTPPKLDIARDVQFEEIGGVQTRPVLATMANAVFGGGSLSNCRRLATVNGELCLFTKDALYSYNAQLASWVLRGTHLAVSIEETARFVTTGDQIECDRAELSGTIVYAWAEGSLAYAAALDKVTGSVLVSPTLVGAAGDRPRLVALATKILLFTSDALSSLFVRSLDPAAPGTAIGGAGTLVTATFNGPYDVERAGAQDLAVGAARQVGSTYKAFTVTPTLTVTTSAKARTCDGPIAVATIADGTQTQIVRANGANVQGDLLTTSTLADVFTGQAIGTAGTNQIAAAFSSTTCTVFWSGSESIDGTPFRTKKNTVTTANVVGTQADFVLMLGVASRAFAYNGRVFVNLVFASDSGASGMGTPLGIRAQLQNTYFLYRDDGRLISKAVFDSAGGYSPAVGHLPSVSLVSGSTQFAWSGARRRLIDLGGTDHTGFGARSPVDIIIDFDSDDARRSAQLGSTLYIGGAMVTQYDGVNLSELGFLIYPWFFLGAPGAPGTGAIAAGQYSYKSTMSAVNAVGELERSTTATGELETANANSKIALATYALWVTLKTGRQTPAIEVWRTLVNVGDGSPFYLITSKDPTVLAGDNRYIPNDPTVVQDPTPALQDNFTDAILSTKETNPENGGVLESLAPPGAKFIAAGDTRLVIAGVPGDPDRVWPSLERQDGMLAAFNDVLPVDAPPTGGPITALWYQDDVLYVGRESAVYALPGNGLDNLGQGQNFGPAQIVSLDVGPVSQEALALTPVGTVFKTIKGWYLMDRGRNLRYIGGPTSAFDGDTVKAVTVISARHQVRILTDSRILMWDYRGAVDANDPDALGRWAEWTVTGGLDATLWNGQYVYLTSTGPKMEQAAYTGLTYGIDIEPGWFKMRELQGFGKVGSVMVLGEFRSPCLVRIRLARDYQYDVAGNVVYFDDKAWSPTPTTVGSALQVRHTPSKSNGNCEAFKVRITAVSDSARATLVTTALAPQIATSGTVWNSTWRAERLSSGAVAYGEMGNRITMTVAFGTPDDGNLLPYDLPFTFEQGLVAVRDGYSWSTTAERWIEDEDNVGVLIMGAITVAELEDAIGQASALISLTAADAAPTKTVAYPTLLAAGLTSTASFTGGAYGAPAGEAFKLTGLALEVGLDPRLMKRLPAGQKQ